MVQDSILQEFYEKKRRCDDAFTEFKRIRSRTFQALRDGFYTSQDSEAYVGALKDLMQADNELFLFWKNCIIRDATQ